MIVINSDEIQLSICPEEDILCQQSHMGTVPFLRFLSPPFSGFLEKVFSGGRGGRRLERGCLCLAECDGVGEVLLLLQPHPPIAVVLGPARRLGSHLQVDLEKVLITSTG